MSKQLRADYRRKKGSEKFHLRFLLHYQSYKGWIHFQSTSRAVAFASSNFFIYFGKAISLTTLLFKRLKIEGALHNPNGVTMRHLALTQPNYKQLVLFCHYPFPPNCQNWFLNQASKAVLLSQLVFITYVSLRELMFKSR